ncbi:hypothetical protein NPIL_303241 [Nephila pilipes]|uniref:Uncharacterized protein n=1 Tax=Nephila pilipes TaxID=299642 RepID=A0A8X6M998_NEPPI|nr:hypothetical protein NPIL_303241 [Nephila pilipes]
MVQRVAGRTDVEDEQRAGQALGVGPGTGLLGGNHLFPELKKHLGGTQFLEPEADEEILYLQGAVEEFYR